LHKKNSQLESNWPGVSPVSKFIFIKAVESTRKLEMICAMIVS